MLDIVFEFTWERPTKGKGFVWEEADTGETRLVRVEDASFKQYEPLKECTGLFRTFAGLLPQPAALLEFANRYGDLGRGWSTLSLWKEGIARMKGLVTTWDALVAEDWRALRAVLSRLPKALFQPAETDAKRASPSE